MTLTTIEGSLPPIIDTRGINMKHIAISVTAISLVASLAFALGGHATVASKENPAKTNKYVLKIQGPAGAKFDMLLITKPTERENPTREKATVVVPFSKNLEATSCYAWFDTLPDGASGKVGDEFEVLFIVNGHSSATAEFKIQPRNKQTAGLGDL